MFLNENTYCTTRNTREIHKVFCIMKFIKYFVIMAPERYWCRYVHNSFAGLLLTSDTSRVDLSCAFILLWSFDPTNDQLNRTKLWFITISEPDCEIGYLVFVRKEHYTSWNSFRLYIDLQWKCNEWKNSLKVG